MDRVRNGRLDNLCEAISEDRKSMAAARADEQGSIQAALREMKAKHLGAYKHAGVELAFVPGEDKLRVRLTKDAEDSSQAFEGNGDEAPDAGDGDQESIETGSDEGAVE
jgi:hypothetical protein